MKLIERLEQLDREATTQWKYEPERYSARCVVGHEIDDRWIAHFLPEWNGEANANLAVTTRNALPEIIAVLKAAKESSVDADPLFSSTERLIDALAALERKGE